MHEVAFTTLKGRTHQINQDAGGAWTWVRPTGTPVSLAIVADGVSAGKHSEFASQLTVERLWDGLAPLAQDPSQDVDMLVAHLDYLALRANEEIAARPRQSLQSADATTLVVVISVGDEIAGRWIGDSRAYSLTAEGFSRITADHSWAEDAVRRGMLTPEQAVRDPRSHMITRWLGPQESSPPVLDAFRFRLNSPGVLLCCSDGLYGYFTPPTGEERELAPLLLDENFSLQQRLDRVADMALQRGGHDDISGAAIQIGLARGAGNGDAAASRPSAPDDKYATFSIRPGKRR